MVEINFSFFNAFVQVDGRNTAYPIENLINQIWGRTSPRDRTAFIKGAYHSLPQLRTFEGARETGTQFFWIGKFLTEKPYTGHLNDDEFELMNQDPYSPAMVVYQHEDHLLAIQSKQYAPRKTAIEDFFNHFLIPEIENHRVKFVLLPQHDQASLDLVDANATIKAIHLEMDANNNQELRALADNQENRFSEIANANVQSARDMGVNVVNIDWKKGRFSRPIPYEVVEMLRNIDFNNQSILKAEVVVKLPNISKPKTINLLEDGILKDGFNIPDGIDAFDALTEQVHEHVQNPGFPAQCLQYFTDNYGNDLMPGDFQVDLIEEDES